jgi:hypothetical protein
MGQGENPVVQQLEERMGRIQELLERPQRSGGGWLKLLGGLGLGALLGGAVAYFLRSREEEPFYAPPPPPPAPPRRDDDAVLLRAAPAPPGAPAAAEEDDQPIVLRTPSAPAAPPAEEAVAAPSAEAPGDDVAAAPEAAVAPAAEEAAAPLAAPAATGDAEELTAEEAMDAPVAEFYPNAVMPTDGQCPASHPIKGNINRNGELIFHTPGSNNYERTNAEACFANEEDAEAAGFRKSRS